MFIFQAAIFYYLNNVMLCERDPIASYLHCLLMISNTHTHARGLIVLLCSISSGSFNSNVHTGMFLVFRNFVNRWKEIICIEPRQLPTTQLFTFKYICARLCALSLCEPRVPLSEKRCFKSPYVLICQEIKWCCF